MNAPTETELECVASWLAAEIAYAIEGCISTADPSVYDEDAIARTAACISGVFGSNVYIALPLTDEERAQRMTRGFVMIAINIPIDEPEAT